MQIEFYHGQGTHTWKETVTAEGDVPWQLTAYGSGRSFRRGDQTMIVNFDSLDVQNAAKTLGLTVVANGELESLRKSMQRAQDTNTRHEITIDRMRDEIDEARKLVAEARAQVAAAEAGVRASRTQLRQLHEDINAFFMGSGLSRAPRNRRMLLPLWIRFRDARTQEHASAALRAAKGQP